MTCRLELNCICKTYATPVLRNVSFQLRPSEIHALLGANGAGKSTLSRIIAGLVHPTSGAMKMDGIDYAPIHKSEAEQRGVQIVQQELNLIDTLSVAENLFLNRLPHRLGFVSQRRLHDLAKASLATVGLEDIDPQARTGTLGIGVRQLIEIASALSRDCRVLILDEPTAALSSTETDRLFDRLRAMRETGVSMIYISHRLDEITAVCDRITVLRDGENAGQCEASKTSTKTMVEMMTGDERSRSDEFRSFRQDVVGLRVSRLNREPVLHSVSFDVKRGERLGITGLVGSGRSELLRTIFGADSADNGSIAILNHDRMNTHHFNHPKQAVRHRIALVTEDRKRDGLLLSQSIRSNLTIASLDRVSNGGFVRQNTERAVCQAVLDKLATKYESMEQQVDELSGGNQQKIVFGKWMLRDADVLLLDEPTRGIDVDARQRIYRIIESQASDGKSIVIVSSDLQELFDNCDAIAVMSRGRMVAKFERNEWSVAAITAASFLFTEQS
jgi:ribose transport system ATP-binding protein